MREKIRKITNSFNKFEENLLNELGDISPSDYVRINKILQEFKYELLMIEKTRVETEEEDVSIRKDVVNGILIKLGMSPGIKGFCYISYILCNKIPLDNITTETYSDVAKKFDTTWSRVERSIRHAIGCAEKNFTKEYQKLFEVWISKDSKPTNLEFLSVLMLVLNGEL